MGTLNVTADIVRGAIRFYGVPYLFILYDTDWERAGHTTYRVDIASLALPLTYGIPTVHWAEEAVVDAGAEAAPCDSQLDANAYRFLL
jgi:hypothetical protein